MTTRKVLSSILIEAPLELVWESLVNSEYTKQYMFGCSAITDWEVGSSLLWEGEYEGKKMVFVKGNVLAIDKGKSLKYSVIDPHAAYPDIPENHLHVTYELESEGKFTRLTVIQDGFETVADGENRYKDVYNNGEGWNPILNTIKEILELKQSNN